MKGANFRKLILDFHKPLFIIAINPRDKFEASLFSRCVVVKTVGI
jgi:hypothetical protein